MTNGQIIPHAVLWSNTSDFRFHLQNRRKFLFSNCVDKEGGYSGKLANDEDISFFLPWRRSNKNKAFHSGYAWYMRTNGKAFSRKILGRGKRHPCSALLHDAYVRVTRSGGGSLSSEESDTARQSARVRQGRRCRAHKKGGISLVDFSLLGKTEILYNGSV